MILISGIPSETPLKMVCDRLDEAGAPYFLFNQRDFAESEIWFEITHGVVRGKLIVKDRVFLLEEFCAVYSRMMDDRNLPELRDEPPDSALRQRCRGFHDCLARWIEITPAHVINRAVA